MDRGALWRPVGTRPPGVYWFRRLMVIGAPLVLVVALVRACGGGAAPSNRSAHTTPTPTATASPTAAASSSRVGPCRASDLQVTAATDASTYPRGSVPRLSAVVRNASSQTCKFRTAPDSRVWTIVSGADQVWTSADCTPSGGTGRTRLRPGHTVAYALIWNRQRSAKGCPSDTPAVGPGTYQLKVTIGGVRAATVVFHLTG